MIYDYFRVTGAHDTVLDSADLFSVTLEDDNVQEFDTRWDEVPLLLSKIPSDDILESLYKLRTRESAQLKTVLELYDMEFHQKISVPNYQKSKTMVKRSLDQKLRLRKCSFRHESNDRAHKPEHTAATPCEPSFSRGRNVSKKRSIQGKRHHGATLRQPCRYYLKVYLHAIAM